MTMARTLSPLEVKWERLRSLQLQRVGIDNQIASLEAEIDRIEAEHRERLELVEGDGAVLSREEVHERVSEMKERLGNG